MMSLGAAFTKALLIGIFFLNGASLVEAKSASPSRGIQRDEVIGFVRIFEDWHYNRGSVSSKDYGRLIEVFLTKLDPEHTYLTQEDADLIAGKFSATLVKDLKNRGDLSVAYMIHDLYKTRLAERTAWILSRLKQWNVGPKENVSAPLSNSTWAQRAESLDQWWEQRLRYEWAVETLQSNDDRASVDRLLKDYQVRSDNLALRSDEDVAELLLCSFAALFDDRSTYYGPKRYKELREATEAKAAGIGVSLRLVGQSWMIEQVNAGGPARQCGKIHPGDRLLAVQSHNGERLYIERLDLSQVIERLRGPDGSQVTVVIEHPYSEIHDEVVLTRGRVPFERARAYFCRFPGAGGKQLRLGVIALPALYGPAPGNPDAAAEKDVRECISQLDKMGAEGIVLDLRANDGGLLSEAIQVAGLFLGNQSIVRVKDYRGKVKVDRAEHIDKIYGKPLTVLVGGATASGAEIVAGSLRDYSRAVVVGTANTAGVGSIQVIVEMKNLTPRLIRSSAQTGAVKLTVQTFYLPNGRSTEQMGIVPDILIPAPPFSPPRYPSDHSITLKHDPLEPIVSAPNPARLRNIATLREQSERRQAENPEFHYLRKWLKDWASYPTGPRGDLDAFREWDRGRMLLRERFEVEGKELAKNAAPLEEVRFSRGLEGRSTVVADQLVGVVSDEAISAKEDLPVDVTLQEALRILADQIEGLGAASASY